MILLNILNYCAGYLKISCDFDTFNEIFHSGIHYWGLCRQEEMYSMFIRKRHYRLFLKNKKLISECIPDPIILQEYGLPHFLKKYRFRYGLMVGSVLFCMLLNLSSRYIWKVNIVGNEEVTNQEIMEELERVGIQIGGYIPSYDFKSLRNQILKNSETLSWIGLNMQGTVLDVEVKERIFKEEVTDNMPSNLIAKSDGQILYYTVYKGTTVIKAGDVVKKGDILVSGVNEYQTGGVRYTNSSGCVYARVLKEFTVEVPYLEEKKVYSGREIEKKTLNFLGYGIKLFNNSSISYEKYDKIKDKDGAMLFGRIELPLNITTETYKEYTLESNMLTEEEAYQKAIYLLRNLVNENLQNCDLLEKKVTVEKSENGVAVQCTLYCVEDIAEQQFFEVN